MDENKKNMIVEIGEDELNSVSGGYRSKSYEDLGKIIEKYKKVQK
jgi:hypothetical protein